MQFFCTTKQKAKKIAERISKKHFLLKSVNKIVPKKGFFGYKRSFIG